MEDVKMRRFARRTVDILNKIQKIFARGDFSDDVVRELIESLKKVSDGLPSRSFRNIDIALGVTDGIVRYVEEVEGTDLIPLHSLFMIAISMSDNPYMTMPLTAVAVKKHLHALTHEFDEDDEKTVKWLSDKVYSYVRKKKIPTAEVLTACANILFRVSVLALGEGFSNDDVSVIMTSMIYAYIIYRYGEEEFSKKLAELDRLNDFVGLLTDSSVM